MIEIDEPDDSRFAIFRKVLVVALIAVAGLIIAVAAHRAQAPKRVTDVPRTIIDFTPTPAPTPRSISATPPPAATPTPEKFTFTPATITKAPISPKALDTPGPIATSIPGRSGLPGLPGSGPGYGDDGTGIGPSSGYGGDPVFAAEVEAAITNAIRTNPATRAAVMNIKVRVWPDATGRIVKALISGSTGSRALDQLIQDKILTGVSIGFPPPPGLHPPIVMTLTAQRP